MKNNLFKRFISLVICLTMVLAYLPSSLLIRADAADTSGILADKTVTDPSTLHAWRDTSFNPNNLTTEHAGGVWTDKSVLEKGDIASAFPGVSGLTVADNNFLVALSALGANSVVAGQGSTPTDTIFVLDVSNSMENVDLREMVAATNDAIHSLLTANPSNRIGVVVYSTEVDVLLELDRYTPVQKGSGNNRTTAYIEMSDTYGQIRTARTGSGFNMTYVKNSRGNNVTTSISASGATFIQGGLWQAYQMFNSATVSDGSTPVLVLMSDGAPTYGSEDYNNVRSRDVGGGGTTSVTDGLAFLTQLTAAYVKEKIADKYQTAAYFYSVGLGVSESYGVSIAEAVLDTSQTRSEPEGWWNTYLGLANRTNKTMSFTVASERVTITYDETVTAASKTYTDRYFPADDASNLNTAFQGIVNEINLKASYNVTRIEGTDAHTGGYVTFVDEIGTGMQVKDIKGILVGNTLYTGQRLAQALLNQEFGTADNPTVLGDNMIWALKQRLGITETETVHDLIWQAYNAGQIAYNAATGEYSNYICWFSDNNGDYLGFWDAADPNCAIPAGAAYANASYGMLGTTTDSQTAHASDMMYIAVMVSKKITQVGGQPALEAKTPELVTFRVPASLLPTVTYQIDVEATSEEEITEQTPATITYNAADPIRLVYEVGVHSALTPENVKDFLREGYQAKDADGNYYLYTNAWYWEPSDGSAADFNNPPTKDNTVGQDVLYDTTKNHITYAYFEPSEQNEHYYFTQDTDLYIKSGTSYQKLTTAPVTDGSVTYYFQHRTFVSKNAAAQTGVAVDAKVNIHYGEVAQKLLEDSSNYAVGSDGVYYIKEGTMHYHTIHEHDREKDPNETGSFGWRLHQLVDIAVDGQNEDSHHFEIAYLGNNGRITYSPAQGFTLYKVMAENATATGEFTFDVTLSGDADGLYTETVNGVSTEKVLTNNAFTVSLAAGSQVTITGLDVGATYSITERERDGYTLGGIVVSAGSTSGATATGTVAENQIHSVTYTNDIQQYGSLLVTKDVTYNKGSQPQADSHAFQITVELTGLAGKQVYVGGVPTTLDSNGRTVLTLKDGEQALLTGIPEGTGYSVVEALAEGTTNIPYGYTADSGYTVTAGSFNGAIVKNEVATAAVQNTYTPGDIELTGTEPRISIDITKEYYLYNGINGYLFNESRTFAFELLKYDTASRDWLPVIVNGAAVKADTTFVNPNTNEDPALGTNTNTGILLNMAGVTLDSAGNHYFRVAEVIPEEEDQQPGMTYDRTFHDFVIVVTDEYLDGKLEISQVRSLQHAEVTGPTDENGDGTAELWNVSTEFENSEITHSTKLTIAAKKTLTGATLKDGQFDFMLYEAQYNASNDTFVIPANATSFPAKNGANGDIIFTTETYPCTGSYADYYYVMKETSTDGNGITTDKTVWEILVEVDGGGSEAIITEIRWRKQGATSWSDHTLGAPENNIFNSITFENTYAAASATLVDLSGSKTLTNLTPGIAESSKNMTVPADTYKFTLEAVTAGAPMPANAEVFAAAGGAIRFGNITYTAAGVYEYKLTENATNVAGVTKDSTVYTVKVNVVDNGLGQLVAIATYWNGNVQVTEPVFNNTYIAAPTGNVVLGGGKELTATAGSERALRPGEFFFTLTKPDGTTETVSNTLENGTRFAFSPITFDTVGNYRYTISEYVPRGAVGNKLNGITYPPVSLTLDLEVYDGGDGTLKVRDSLQNNIGTNGSLNYVSHFENTYDADDAVISLTGIKNLEGRELQPDEFQFKLEAITTGAPMPENTTVSNGEEGVINFGNITYTAIGTYQYKVTELKLDENSDPIIPDPVTGEYIYNGVTYSTKEYTVTVTVRDNGNGKLVTQIASVDEEDISQPGGIVFINTYRAESVTIQVEGNAAATDGKVFTDESSLPENKKDLDDYVFRFTLEAITPGAPMPANPTVSDNGAGFSFEALTFDTAGAYQYLIYERPDAFAGIIYDTAVYRVTVTVTDNGVGQLQAAVKYEKASSGESDDYAEAESIQFKNSYKAKETAVAFTGTKTLTGGRKLKVNDFTFLLKDTAGEVLGTAKNDANGNFTFDAISFTKEGTYTYQLTEKDEGASGITYDTAAYTLTVTVVDVDGQLQATTAITKGTEAAETAGFTNIFTPEATVVTVSVNKELVNNSNKAISLEGFRFLLEADGWNQTLTTDVAGKAELPLTFTAEDVGKTYTFKLSEVAGNVKNMTYDKTVYEITVRITQAEDGQLQATVEREGTGAFRFVNTYNNDPDNPKTGDGMNLGLTVALMLSSVACMFVLILSRKRFAD